LPIILLVNLDFSQYRRGSLFVEVVVDECSVVMTWCARCCRRLCYVVVSTSGRGRCVRSYLGVFSRWLMVPVTWQLVRIWCIFNAWIWCIVAGPQTPVQRTEARVLSDKTSVQYDNITVAYAVLCTASAFKMTTFVT